MPKADILMAAPMIPLVMEKLDQRFTLHRLWQVGDREDFLSKIGPQILGIATTPSHPRTDARLLECLPALEIISCFGVGYDNVDTETAAKRKVIVTNTPGVLDDEVADFTIGLLLATLRQMPQGERYLRQGKWLKEPFPLSPTLRDRKVGIVGLGRIGKAIARRLEGFGVDISYHGRTKQIGATYPHYENLLDLAENVDVLIVITPGGAGTRHLIDAPVLKALGSRGVLINVARGSVVDEEALIEALRSKTILTAGLDVFADEPRVPQALIDMDHVVLMPHLASASVHTRNAMGQLVVDNLTSWFSGNGPITPVPETPWGGR